MGSSSHGWIEHQQNVKAMSKHQAVPHLQTIHIHIHMATVTIKDFSQVKYLWPPHASCDAGIWCEIAPRWERDLTVAALAQGLKTRSGDPGPSPPKKKVGFMKSLFDIYQPTTTTVYLVLGTDNPGVISPQLIYKGVASLAASYH